MEQEKIISDAFMEGVKASEEYWFRTGKDKKLNYLQFIEKRRNELMEKVNKIIKGKTT